MQNFLDKIIQGFFSMKSMALAMFVFLISIGLATFIEAEHDIQAAKILIYNALWFEILLIYLSINLISNIFKYKMIQLRKISLLMFHISFLVIILGAGVTRYFGFEGLMIIREGAKSDFIYSSDPYLSIRIIDVSKEQQFKYEKKLYASEFCNNDFSVPIDFLNRKIKFKYVDFKSNMVDSLIVNDSIEKSSIELITEGKKSNILSHNEFLYVGKIPISFEKKNKIPGGIEIKEQNGEIFIKSNYNITFNPPMFTLKNILPEKTVDSIMKGLTNMPDSLTFKIPLNKWTEFKSGTRYVIDNAGQFVYKQRIEHAQKMQVKSSEKDAGLDVLKLEITDHKNSVKKISLMGGMGALSRPIMFHQNGLDYEVSYGSKPITLPFSIQCIDFILDKYPGSESPSSFESKLKIIDSSDNYFKESNVFMNHVLDYKGYRFFQSAYDLDNPETPENEEGTRLSVNYDWWGTNITYLGYFLLIIGMILSVFSKNGRFKELNKQLNKLNKQKKNISAILILFTFLCFNNTTFCQSKKKTNYDTLIVSKEYSEEVASLLIQNYAGRIVPFQTLCNQLLRKIHRNDRFEQYNSVQTILSMHMYPRSWFETKLIPVPKAVRDLKGTDKLASCKDLMDSTNGLFIWVNDYKVAHQKMEKERNEFDKKIIKLAERYEVLQEIFIWHYMKIIPLKKSNNNEWVLPFSKALENDSIGSKMALRFFTTVNQSIKSKDYIESTFILNKIKDYQRKNSKSDIVPSISMVNAEIFYNKLNIFKKTYQYYLLFGFSLLVIFFINIFRVKKSKIIEWIKKIFTALLILTFIFHGLGIGLRWYISGHAPWSNGYEAVVFIAWITMISGFIFSFRNSVVIAGTAILASLMIFVTEMNLLDPEITPLVPVLKSYWLMIHVAVITSSYGFLGLAFILGLINLILYIFRNPKNGNRISNHISELTRVNELTMTIGVFMLTIGTFLGGIWANESWGRYWGWDPKETWALVSVLVYAVILHLRFIPSLKSEFVFNTVSFWGYSAILFTFFGVNFVLVGLHSYAQPGDGIAEIPQWIYYTIASFILINVLASVRNKKYLQHK